MSDGVFRQEIVYRCANCNRISICARRSHLGPGQQHICPECGSKNLIKIQTQKDIPLLERKR